LELVLFYLNADFRLSFRPFASFFSTDLKLLTWDLWPKVFGVDWA